LDVFTLQTVESISVLPTTARGLAGHVQLSDVMNRYMWDMYRVYVDGDSWAQARVKLPGDARRNNANEPHGGYVAEKEYDEEFLDGVRTRTKIGSIHLEFSYAGVYPRTFLAYGIVHEATHKFARTDDNAYTDDDAYARLNRALRLRNADSYAYVVLSLHLNRLIKDLAMSLQTIPRKDSTLPTRFTRRAADEV
jgi:hypothetical protein